MQQVLNLDRKIIAGLILGLLMQWNAAIAAPEMIHATRMSGATLVADNAGMQHVHACCPRRQIKFVAPQPEMPCGSGHDCCLRQAPQNTPALPLRCTDEHKVTPSVHANPQDFQLTACASPSISRIEILCPSEYSRRSAVLRI
jgi:hypothetical protein